ncbi:uncharacterized protein Z518_11143 [Rhinocladiella mackenziei CBS 650.93]|uniref:Uncharacterized protein n=1 Tax=Rhinocladiella mackenziei CBS 650.93 TaxID=1442369 RepID=A0A0D2I900_9EURO|nr:uncharacterized protein Z518_11143 [Rhinocladiella mackenziei CBS 650.93]KIW99730.1 hypothetical protein Z518_11143 [Rhinocladiella mackenziei CBS 650.93]
MTRQTRPHIEMEEAVKKGVASVDGKNAPSGLKGKKTRESEIDNLAKDFAKFAIDFMRKEVGEWSTGNSLPQERNYQTRFTRDRSNRLPAQRYFYGEQGHIKPNCRLFQGYMDKGAFRVDANGITYFGRAGNADPMRIRWPRDRPDKEVMDDWLTQEEPSRVRGIRYEQLTDNIEDSEEEVEGRNPYEYGIVAARRDAYETHSAERNSKTSETTGRGVAGDSRTSKPKRRKNCLSRRHNEIWKLCATLPGKPAGESLPKVFARNQKGNPGEDGR